MSPLPLRAAGPNQPRAPPGFDSGGDRVVDPAVARGDQPPLGTFSRKQQWQSRAVFYREPGAMFWTFGFPLVLSLILGVAFRNRPPEPVVVAVEAEGAAVLPRAEHAHAILAAAKDVDAKRMSAAEAEAASTHTRRTMTAQNEQLTTS